MFVKHDTVFQANKLIVFTALSILETHDIDLRNTDTYQSAAYIFRIR